jgi:hypothetical protein
MDLEVKTITPIEPRARPVAPCRLPTHIRLPVLLAGSGSARRSSWRPDSQGHMTLPGPLFWGWRCHPGWGRGVPTDNNTIALFIQYSISFSLQVVLCGIQHDGK